MAATERFDPRTETWTKSAAMQNARSDHTATRLPGGKVLLVNGALQSEALNGEANPTPRSAEIYDPVADKSTFTAQPRELYFSIAALLPSGPLSACGSNCGKVYFSGTAAPDKGAPAELFTPVPEVAKVGLASGPVTGGSPVTLEGTGLASVTSVKFGETEAVSVTPDPGSPDTKLVALAPPHVAGAVPVTATSRGGTSASGTQSQFVYTADAASPGPGPGPGTVDDGAATSPTETTPAGAAQTGVPLGSVTTPAGGGPQQGAAPPAITNAAQARRARALRSCLARVKRHAASERAATRRGPARRRARVKRHLARHQSSARRGCLARHGLTPGPVTRFSARASSATAIQLSFSAAGSNASRPPAARRYVVKQSLRPIRNASDFRRAQTLCAGACRFAPQRVGERLELTVTDLRRRTTYYYAIAARDDITPRLGPRSRTISVKTR